MISWHREGQKVICINDKREEDNGDGDEILPEIGKEYTIRDIVILDVYPDVTLFRLEEIINEVHVYHDKNMDIHVLEPAFRSTRFQPIYPQQIEEFRKLLKVKKKELENV